MSPLKLQRGAPTLVICVITGHYIMHTHAKLIGLEHLANDFCRSFKDEEEEETVPHLLGTCQALCQRRKKYLSAYYMNDLDELSRIDTKNINFLAKITFQIKTN